MIQILLTSALVFLIVIPFGYWRSNVKTFSVQWFLAIHIPVPFIIAIRIISEIGFAWYTYIFLVAAFFLGQKAGGLLIKKVNRFCHHASSCLVMDLYRCIHF